MLEHVAAKENHITAFPRSWAVMNSLWSVVFPVTGGTNPEPAAELAQGSAGHQHVLGAQLCLATHISHPQSRTETSTVPSGAFPDKSAGCTTHSGHLIHCQLS